MSQGESKLSRQIMEACRKRGAFCFKVHGSPLMMVGLPDIIMCYRGEFVAFETKMPEGKDPTAIQVHVMGKIIGAGGRAYVVRHVNDAMVYLDAIDACQGQR